MTARQINRKLEDAGFNMAVVIASGRNEVEILVTDDSDATTEAKDHAATGHDSCDTSNPTHY